MTCPAVTIDAVLAPRSVAVIGASDDAGRIGGRPIASMLRAGYSGRIYPVNPGRNIVQGLTCYPDVAALPEAPDAALIAVPARLVAETLKALGRKGCKAVSLFAAGFAETGVEGEAAQDVILAIAASYGMRLLGPNTLGVYNTQLGYFGTFSSAFDTRMPLRGNIGIASQSGAFGAHLGALAQARSLGTSVFVATGNEADLTVADAVSWMAGDAGTDVICAYLEAINDGPELLLGLDLARENGKPVIVLKAGSSTLGAQAAASHTASLAGDFAVSKAVLEEYGAVLVQDLDTMMDFAYLAAKKVFPKTHSLGVVTVSGGAGIVISDEAERLGLPLPPMPQVAQAKLLERLPFASAVNPLDCTAQAVNDLDLLATFARAALEEGGYGAVLCFLTYVAGSPFMADAIIETLTPLRQTYPETILGVCAIGEDAVLQRYDDAGICVFTDPVRAVRAMDAACRFGASFATVPRKKVKIQPTAPLPDRTSDEAEAKTLLAKIGIASPPEAVACSADGAADHATQLGFPIVMKIVSPDIVHKSDIGGVRLNISSADAARTAYDDIISAAATHAPDAEIRGVLVARQLSGGIECFMGIKQDPSFGPIAAFGLGGIFVEILNDVALRRCPFDLGAAREMILSIKAAAILQGARGKPPTDLDALAEMLSRLSHFAAGADDRLASMDLNPVLAMPEGQGAFALDAVVEIIPETADT
jgi:acyl-CoA synthetase (NDP forming)